MQNTKAYINPPLLEKMTYALSLAELLQLNGLDFIFKGGTCLILLLDTPQRFSIDIDIITQANRVQIETILTKICLETHFTAFELDDKRSYREGIPKAHYKLYFEPQLAHPKDNKILLDILFAENPYPQIQETPITTNWLNTVEPLTKVQLPTIESITGDKLTAFAPRTIGIRYGQNPPKSTEIIKQMFDLGQLFDKITDFEIVIEAFLKNAEKELSYRTDLIGKTFIDALDDTLETCFDVVKENHAELQTGIKTFGSWTVFPFRREQALETAGKVAYMVAKIKKNDTTPLLHFSPQTMLLKDFFIQNPDYNFLNKKVKFANHALFYWFHVVKILET